MAHKFLQSQVLHSHFPASGKLTDRLLYIALLVVLVVVLGGCSPLTLVNAIAPDDGFKLKKGIAYGPLERQRLDVYYPELVNTQAPVVVFFYGGSWRRGDKTKYRFVGQALSSQGYVTIIPDYRLYPEVQFPAFVEDGASSVAWVNQHIAQAKNGIILMGHSAGAHLAALLALDRRYLSDKGITDKLISGMIGLAGPYAFDPEKFQRFRPIFATAQPADISKPLSYARRDAPPLLLLHGADDRVVLPLHSLLLEERMEAESGRVRRLELQGADHFDIVLALSEPFSHLVPELLPVVKHFIQDRT